MMRADPDIIMVGEIRDSETAQIAVEAALTGHLVLSTLHTNDAPGAITRLIEMGIEPFLVASAIDCVVAQRLCRTLCQHCKTRTIISADVLQRARLPVEHRPRGLRGRRLRALRRQRLQGPHRPLRGHAAHRGDPLAGHRARQRRPDRRGRDARTACAACATTASRRSARAARRSPRSPASPPRASRTSVVPPVEGAGPTFDPASAGGCAFSRGGRFGPSVQAPTGHALCVRWAGEMNFDFADLLLEVVARRASDLHITAGSPPMVRARGRLVPIDGLPEARPDRDPGDRLLDPHQRPAPEAGDRLADRLRLLGARPRALPRQRLLPALGDRRGLPPDPGRHHLDRRPRPADRRSTTSPRSRAASCSSPARPARASRPRWRR